MQKREKIENPDHQDPREAVTQEEMKRKVGDAPHHPQELLTKKE